MKALPMPTLPLAPTLTRLPARARRTRVAVASIALLLAVATTTSFAGPLDLAQAWQGAQTHDRELAVARLSYEASRTRAEQAQALGRPQVFASGTAGLAQQTSRMQGAQFSAPGLGTSGDVGFATSVTAGAALRWSVMAQHALVNAERDANRAQLGLAVQMGELAWQGARTDLMLRTAQRYYELALAEERVRVLQTQAQAVTRAATEAQDRYDLGAAPITDTHEARAALAEIQARLAAARADVRVRQQVLADSTGVPDPSARLPAAARAIASASASAANNAPNWPQRAADNAVAVRLQQRALELAEHEARKLSQGASTTVDLIAQAGQDRISGSGAFGQASQRGTQALVGVQVRVPLYTGGLRDAREREALLLAERARAQLEETRQQVARQAQALQHRLQAEQERLQALSQALTASQARLDATRLGRELGDRTTLDLLNAENHLAQTRLSQAEARVARQLHQLQLAALADALDEQVWLAGNAGLE